MFENIARKLKIVSSILSVLGIIASGLLGMILIAINPNSWFLGLFIIAFGSIGSWISSLGMYGLGQLIENTDKLVAFQEQPRAPKKTQIEDIEDDLPEL